MSEPAYFTGFEVLANERTITPGTVALEVLQQMVGFDKGDEFREELLDISRSLFAAVGERKMTPETVTELCAMAVRIATDGYQAGLQ